MKKLIKDHFKLQNVHVYGFEIGEELNVGNTIVQQLSKQQHCQTVQIVSLPNPLILLGLLL